MAKINSITTKELFERLIALEARLDTMSQYDIGVKRFFTRVVFAAVFIIVGIQLITIALLLS